MTYEERLRELKLPSLTHRRRRGDMIFTYKILTAKTNMNKEDFFAMTHLTTRGYPHEIFKHHDNKLPRINTFSIRIVNDWNRLPSYINTFSIRIVNDWNRLPSYINTFPIRIANDWNRLPSYINTFSIRIVNDWNKLLSYIHTFSIRIVNDWNKLSSYITFLHQDC